MKDFAVFSEADRLRTMFCHLGGRIRVVMVELGYVDAACLPVHRYGEHTSMLCEHLSIYATEMLP